MVSILLHLKTSARQQKLNYLCHSGKKTDFYIIITVYGVIKEIKMSPSQIIENFEMGGYSMSMTLESYARQYCDVSPSVRDSAVAQYQASQHEALEAYRAQLKVEYARQQAWLKTPEGIAFTEKQTAREAKREAAIQANKNVTADLMAQAKKQASKEKNT